MDTSKSVANATASVVAASKQCMKMTEESKLVAVDYSQLSAVQVTNSSGFCDSLHTSFDRDILIIIRLSPYDRG